MSSVALIESVISFTTSGDNSDVNNKVELKPVAWIIDMCENVPVRVLYGWLQENALYDSIVLFSKNRSDAIQLGHNIVSYFSSPMDSIISSFRVMFIVTILKSIIV